MAGIVDLGTGEAVGEIVSEVGGFLGKILDKIAPDKMSEAEKENARLAFEGQMEGYFTTLMTGFYDMVKAQMSTKINVVVDTVRGLVRPVITFTAFGFYSWIKYLMVGVLYEHMKIALIAAADTASKVQIVKEFTEASFTWYDFIILSSIITFWFGGRMIERYVTRAMDTEVGTTYNGGVTPGKTGDKRGILRRIFGYVF